jgi:copper transport protein
MTARVAVRIATTAASIALVAPGIASAHALLVRSEPVDGARLQVAPRVIRLDFDETISAGFRALQLVRADGRAVQGVRLRRASPRRVELVVPHLRRGAYGLVWHILSEDDGHATSGTLTFGVGVDAVSQMRRASIAPPLADVAIRWMRFAAFAVVLGGLAFAGLVLPFARPWLEPRLVRRAGRRVLAAAAVAGGAAIAVHVASLARQVAELAAAGGRSWGGTLGSLLLGQRWGTLWSSSLVLLALLTWLVLALRRRAPEAAPVVAALALVAAAAFAAVEAVGSHAAALHAPLAVFAEWTHVLAAALWLGVVLALVIALAPVRGVRPADARAVARVVRRPFAVLAGSSLLVAVVTGLYSAGLQVASVDALLTSLYGRALLVKAVLVTACCAVGAANFFALRLLDRRRLRRALRVSIGVEAGAGAGALLAAAVLTASAPARGPQFEAPQPVRAPTLAAQAADLVLSVTVSPNRPGVNLVSVVAASSRRPPPAPIASVAVRNAGSTAVTELRLTGGRWVGSVRLRSPGDAALGLLVRRGRGELASRVQWRVGAPDPAHPVRFSSRRLASILDPALVLLLAALGGAGAVTVFLRRERPRLPWPHRVARERHA